LAPERLGNMNPQVWNKVSQNVWTAGNKFPKGHWTKVLRNKFAKIHTQLLSTLQWTSETTCI